MRKKYQFQIAMDGASLVVLISLMGYGLWSEWAHETLGLLFLSLLIIHNGMHLRWYRHLTKGRYQRQRWIQLVVNSLTALVLLGALISGLMLSRHIWPEAPFHQGSELVRNIHMISVHWLEIIIAMHVGLHWSQLAAFFGALLGRPERNSALSRLMFLAWCVIAAYGGYVFILRGTMDYLLARVSYSFIDPSTLALPFYLDHLAMVVCLALLTHGLSRVASRQLTTRPIDDKPRWHRRD